MISMFKKKLPLVEILISPVNELQEIEYYFLTSNINILIQKWHHDREHSGA